jgi:hypothetical protein
MPARSYRRRAPVRLPLSTRSSTDIQPRRRNSETAAAPGRPHSQAGDDAAGEVERQVWTTEREPGDAIAVPRESGERRVERVALPANPLGPSVLFFFERHRHPTPMVAEGLLASGGERSEVSLRIERAEDEAPRPGRGIRRSREVDAHAMHGTNRRKATALAGLPAFSIMLQRA